MSNKSNKWKYLLSYALPWASMLSIEKNGIALATFILQLSVIGWIPAAIWAHAEMKKHLQSQGDEPRADEPSKTPEKVNSSQEIIKASKKTTTAKKTKPTSTKKTIGTTKPKAKASTKPKASS